MATARVTIKVTPTGGKPTEKSVDIEPTGASVAQIMEKAGMKLEKNQQIMVDGEPGDHRTHVPSGGVISFTEKVRGS